MQMGEYMRMIIESIPLINEMMLAFYLQILTHITWIWWTFCFPPIWSSTCVFLEWPQYTRVEGYPSLRIWWVVANVYDDYIDIHGVVFRLEALPKFSKFYSI
jgi:hypothetical protein